MQITQSLRAKTARGVNRVNRPRSISATSSSAVVVLWSKHFLSTRTQGSQFPPSCRDTHTRTHRDGIVLTTRMEAEWLVRSSKHWHAVHISIFQERVNFYLKRSLGFPANSLPHLPSGGEWEDCWIQLSVLGSQTPIAATPPLPTAFCGLSTLIAARSIALFIFVKFIKCLAKCHYK